MLGVVLNRVNVFLIGYRPPYADGPYFPSITEVSVSSDMRNATVFCMSLGGEDVETVIAALNRCRSYLRGELGRAITLKFTPALTFRADPSFDEAQSIDDLLRSPKVARDIAKPDTEPDDGAAS